MRKYSESEKFEPLDKEQTIVVQSNLQKTGKASVADLTEEELEELRTELTPENK